MKIHIVQKGDTLWEIAKKYNVDFEELKQLNSHLASPDMIMPGMKIRIPSETKTVKQGTNKTQMKKTMPAKKESPVQKQEKTMPAKKESPVQKQEKTMPAEKPKLMHEKPITLPTLEGEKGHYPTTVFPEIQPKKEKPAAKKEEPKKAQVKETPKPVQPVQEYPVYEAPMPMEYPCCPPPMPAFYSPCHYFHPPMMMPEYMGCGCCGQRAQMPGYYPFTMHPPMHPPVNPPMSPMYSSYPTEEMQMYPNEQSTFAPRRNEQELYPMPPEHHAGQQEKITDVKNKTEE